MRIPKRSGIIAAALYATVLSIAPAAGQGGGFQFDGSDMTMTCEAVIANAEADKRYMIIAAGTYFHGIFMGKPCVEVDYERAFDLARRSGRGIDEFVDVLRDRAATGNPRAISALRRLGY